MESLKDAVVMLLKGNFAKYVRKDVFLMGIVMEVTTCFSIFLQLGFRPGVLWSVFDILPGESDYTHSDLWRI